MDIDEYAARHVKCEAAGTSGTSDEEDEAELKPLVDKVTSHHLSTPRLEDHPPSLVPYPGWDFSSPRYSPTHPDYENRLYYETLSKYEAEDRVMDRAYQKSPLGYRKCKTCQNTTMCPGCCTTKNDLWAFREGHRVQSRLASSNAVLHLIETHVRQLRNEGGIEEATRFISRAEATLQAHRRTMPGFGFSLRVFPDHDKKRPRTTSPDASNSHENSDVDNDRH
jgi:hypothetical protein